MPLAHRTERNNQVQFDAPAGGPIGRQRAKRIARRCCPTPKIAAAGEFPKQCDRAGTPDRTLHGCILADFRVQGFRGNQIIANFDRLGLAMLPAASGRPTMGSSDAQEVRP